MKPFETTGAGLIKFSNKKTLNGGTYLITYLIQHVSETGKKSHFTLKQFSDVEIDPLPKDTEIEFTGILRENSYKDKTTDEYVTTGLEVIATTITNMEVF